MKQSHSHIVSQFDEVVGTLWKVWDLDAVYSQAHQMDQMRMGTLGLLCVAMSSVSFLFFR